MLISSTRVDWSSLLDFAEFLASSLSDSEFAAAIDWCNGWAFYYDRLASSFPPVYDTFALISASRCASFRDALRAARAQHVR